MHDLPTSPPSYLSLHLLVSIFTIDNSIYFIHPTFHTKKTKFTEPHTYIPFLPFPPTTPQQHHPTVIAHALFLVFPTHSSSFFVVTAASNVAVFPAGQRSVAWPQKKLSLCRQVPVLGMVSYVHAAARTGGGVRLMRMSAVMLVRRVGKCIALLTLKNLCFHTSM